MSCNHDGSMLYVEIVDPEPHGIGLAKAVACFGPSISNEQRFPALWCFICGALANNPGTLPGEQEREELQPLLLRAALSWGELRLLRKGCEHKWSDDVPDDRNAYAPPVPFCVLCGVARPVTEDAAMEAKSAQSWSVYSELFVQMEVCPQCSCVALRKVARLGDDGERSFVIVCDDDDCDWQMARNSQRPEV